MHICIQSDNLINIYQTVQTVESFKHYKVCNTHCVYTLYCIQ